MRKILFALMLVPVVGMGQKINKTVNRFDGTIEYTYTTPAKMLGIPVSFYKKIKNGDTVCHAMIVQQIDRSDFMNHPNGKLESLELLINGNITPVDLTSLNYAVAQFESNGYSYVAYGVISIDRDNIDLFKNITGVRINKIGEGAMISKKNQDYYNRMLDLFISDNPQLIN